MEFAGQIYWDIFNQKPFIQKQLHSSCIHWTGAFFGRVWRAIRAALLNRHQEFCSSATPHQGSPAEPAADGRRSGWVLHGHHVPTSLWRQQGGGRVTCRPLKSLQTFWLTTRLRAQWCRPMLQGIMQDLLCISGCYGHKRRESHGLGASRPWPQPYWEPLEHPQAKGLWGWEAVLTRQPLWEAILTSEIQKLSYNSKVQWMQELWSYRIRGRC